MMALFKRGGSIRKRLLAFLLAGAVAMTVGLYLIVQSVAQQMAQESQDNILTASTFSIIDNVRVVGGEIEIDIPYFAFSMLGSVADERVFYGIWLDDEFLSGYEALPKPQFTNEDPLYQTTRFLNEDVRIATVQRSLSIESKSSILTVSVSQTLKGQQQRLQRISRLSLGIGIASFLLTALFAIIVANTSIRPLQRLTGSLSRRGPTDLRPISTDVPVEMAPLVKSLNNFMTRLKATLSRSEDFIAEAAHHVRTPLAIVRTQAEITMRRVKKEENRASLRQMIHAIDETSRSAGQLLDHAMVSLRLDHLDDEIIHLPNLIKETLERIKPIAELQDIAFSAVTLQDVSVKGDAILLETALSNILDNALKYVPREGSVIVNLHHKDQNAVLSISDTGPGFPELETHDFAKRFERGTNAADIVGSGLGLTIVDEVIQAHGGTLELTNNKKGGACVIVSLPSA